MSSDRDGVEHGYVCTDCGWVWPLATEPRLDAVCEQCGGALVGNQIIEIRHEFQDQFGDTDA